MEHDETINSGSGDTVTFENPITGGTDFSDKALARHFASISELVIMMGCYSPDQDLTRLCLVNRKFNAIFSSRLYRLIRLDVGFLNPENLAWVAGNSRFRHTKILSLTYSRGFPRGPPLSEEICSLVQWNATDILRRSPTLHTIITFIGTERTVLILNNGFNGEFKHSSTKLQCLVLNLGATPCRELSPSIFQQQSLKLLYLDNIPADSWMVRSLCQALKDSPALRCLQLSCSNGEWNRRTLEEICKQYNQLGGAPLKLETLGLGRSFGVNQPSQVLSSTAGASTSAQASYLPLLTDPTCLQNMRIFATKKTAWGTFDSSFFPNLKYFYLSASASLKTQVARFFAMRKTRDFLRRVHLQIDGTLFRADDSRAMTQYVFRLRVPSDPTSTLAPMGFSFQFNLPGGVLFERSIALPLPSTRYLDITIHYKHLVGFCGIGLSAMSALECLSLNIYVWDISEWGESGVVSEKQGEALSNAAESCPNLRYVKMKMGATGPVYA